MTLVKPNYLFKIQCEFWEGIVQSITTSQSYLGSILSRRGIDWWKEVKMGMVPI